MVLDRLKLVLPYVLKLVGKIAFEPAVKEVYLFGSFAAGNPSRSSDIDIFVIVDDKTVEKRIRDVASELDLEMETTGGFEHVFSITADKTLEPSLLQGSIALWKRVVFAGNKKPIAIVEYDVSSLTQSQKNKVSRTLYGYVSIAKKNKKVYTNKVEGVLEKTSARKLKDSILVDEAHAEEITNTLKKMGAKVTAMRGDLQQA